MDITPFNVAYGTARALGFYAQSEPECNHPAITTLVDHPSPDRYFTASPSEMKGFNDRCDRVKKGFQNGNHVKSGQSDETRRKLRSAALNRNRTSHA